MGDCDNFINILLIGGAIALVWCGLSIAKPNLHGIKFVEGKCTINSVTTISDWDELPSCTCGKGCSEEYPCLTVYASFESTANGTDVNFNRGTVHEDYSSLKSNCLVTPEAADHCNTDFSDNAAIVYKYFIMNIAPLVNYDIRYPYLDGWNVTSVNYTDVPSFNCWGYDNSIYIQHSYSILNAKLALGIPSGCIIVGIILALCTGSDGQREMVVGLICCPFVLIGGVLGWSSRSLRDCSRGCRRSILSCLSCRCCRDNGQTVIQPESGIAVSPRRTHRPTPNQGVHFILQSQMSTSSTRSRRVSDTSIQSIEAPRHRRRRVSFGGLDTERAYSPQPPYIPPSYPPSYNEAAPSYAAAPRYTTPNITAPRDVPPYTATLNMPPPPAYEDVVASDDIATMSTTMSITINTV